MKKVTNSYSRNPILDKLANFIDDNRVLTVSLILFASFISWLVVVIAYTVNFGLIVSAEQSIWAEFGDYVGGVLGPIFNLFGLVLLSAGLWLSGAQIKDSEMGRWEERIFDMCRQYWSEEFQLTRQRALDFWRLMEIASKDAVNDNSDAHVEALEFKVKFLDWQLGIIDKQCVIEAAYDLMSIKESDTPSNLNDIRGDISEQLSAFLNIIQFYATIGFASSHVKNQNVIGLLGDDYCSWIHKLHSFIHFLELRSSMLSSRYREHHMNEFWRKEINRLYSEITN